jgi:hypothetical protein
MSCLRFVQDRNKDGDSLGVTSEPAGSNPVTEFHSMFRAPLQHHLTLYSDNTRSKSQCERYSYPSNSDLEH